MRYCTACSSGRQPNFAALNRGRQLCSAGRPSRWSLAHISSFKNLKSVLFVFSARRNCACACSVCENATWQCAITPECSGGILGEVRCPHNQVYRHQDSSSCTLTCTTYDIGCPTNLSPHDACGCPSNTVMSANVRPPSSFCMSALSVAAWRSGNIVGRN